VRSDPDLLSEIIQNLVSNAIRYTNKGDVRLRCEIDGDQVCVRVSDTGVGIEEQHLQDVFREFHQIKSPGQKTEGFGLGLAIVQRMSDLLKHQIEVESTPGEGSEFSVCVPVAELSVRDTGAGNDIQRRSVGRQGTVILIEDDTAVADALTLLLESEGLVVASATSASEAKAVTRHLDDPPDLIISDYHLIDNSTGLDAVNAIREIVDDLIPAFIVTGDTSMVVDEAKHLRNSILIRKPVDPEQLIADAAEAIETGEGPRSSGD
jgi:CheY-like chemotaxis protein